MERSKCVFPQINSWNSTGMIGEDLGQMSFAINDLLLSNVVYSSLWTLFIFAKSRHLLLCLSTLIDLELVTGHLQAPTVRDQLQRTTITRFCRTAAKRFCLICEFHFISTATCFLVINFFVSLLFTDNMVFKTWVNKVNVKFKYNCRLKVFFHFVCVLVVYIVLAAMYCMKLQVWGLGL